MPPPTSAECPFGRLYCKAFARTGDLSLAGDGRGKTKKATVVNDIGRKGLDRSNPVVAAVLSGFANGCEFCHRGCYQFYRQRKPPYVLSAVSGSSNSGDSSSKHGASSDGGAGQLSLACMYYVVFSAVWRLVAASKGLLRHTRDAPAGPSTSRRPGHRRLEHASHTRTWWQRALQLRELVVHAASRQQQPHIRSCSSRLPGEH